MNTILQAFALLTKYWDVVQFVIQTVEDGKLSADEVKAALKIAIIKAFDEKTKKDLGL